MDRDELLQAVRAQKFTESNGRVLKMVNILRYSYIGLEVIKDSALSDLSENEFLDSVNFLQKAGYISLRRIEGHDESTLADSEYTELEGIVTEKGIRLIGLEIRDKSVRL